MATMATSASVSWSLRPPAGVSTSSPSTKMTATSCSSPVARRARRRPSSCRTGPTCSSALWVSTEFPAGPTASMFPLYHMSGWASATVPWLRGEEVVLCDASDVGGLLRAIETRRAERFYAIPAVWHRILDVGVDQFDLSSLRRADTGTSATSLDLLDAIHEALPHTTTDVTYGSTEAGGVCKLAFTDIHRKPNSVGQPGPSVFVRVDENGELWTTSPFLFTGYFRNPQASADALVDGWFRTGEVATIDGDGYVSIVGRATEMIRSGGESVAPAEIDLVLMQHPADRGRRGRGDPRSRVGRDDRRVRGPAPRRAPRARGSAASLRGPPRPLQGAAPTGARRRDPSHRGDPASAT